jgi:small subunit ribosomal protein S3Ae
MSAKGKKGRTARKVVDSWKTKTWYELYAPKSFKESFIGQIPAENNENIMGRVVENLLYDFTDDFKHAHIKLRFRVVEVTGQRCTTRFVGHELTRDYVRALIHRGSSRIDGIFNYKTADGYVYRVSAFCVTKRRAKQSQQKTIRKIIYEVVNELAKSSKHSKFVRGMIYGQYAQNLAKLVKNIYPLKECQIRKSKLVSTPEGAVEEDYEEDEVFEEKGIKLKEHGKTVRAKKKQRKSGQKSDNEVTSEAPEEPAVEIKAPAVTNPIVEKKIEETKPTKLEIPVVEDKKLAEVKEEVVEEESEDDDKKKKKKKKTKEK